MIGTMLFAFALQAAADDATIVVTGRRVTEEYEACRQGGCLPVRDANATLAYAQQQLLAGDYKGSRRALQAAIRRHAGAAKTHPFAVSALYDADSTLALHLGDYADARRSGLKAVGLLRDVYAPGDPRAIAARVRIGDVEAKIGGSEAINNADRAYEAAAAEARRAGLPLLADAIELRRSWLLSVRGQALKAQTRLERYANDTAVDPRLRLQAAVLASRVARGRGDDRTADRLLTLVGRQPADAKPILLSAPEIRLRSLDRAVADERKWGASSAFEPRGADYVPLRWIDIGFWIRPDGRVEDAEVLRGSALRDWAAPVLAAAEGRRYVPVTAAPGDPGRYRIERYTLTAAVMVPKGSLIARRAGPVELRRLDITDDPDRKAEAQLPAS